MSPATKISTDQSLETNFKIFAGRQVPQYASSIKQMLQIQTVEQVKAETWKFLEEILREQCGKATNSDDVLESTEKKLYKLIDELAEKVKQKK
jgi:hypothetical protein